MINNDNALNMIIFHIHFHLIGACRDYNFENIDSRPHGHSMTVTVRQFE